MASLDERVDFIRWGRPDIGPEEYDAVRECFEANWISQGPKVEEFESVVAACARRRHCVAVNSGSSALLALLTALGVRGGSEVVIPAMSFIAVPYAVSQLGATPVLADIDRTTGMVTAETVGPCVSERTAAVIGIDYSGFANDWASLAELCRRSGVAFVVDSASSFMATYRDRPAGSYGDAAIYSFHAAKPITTGEGGAVVTDDERLAARLKRVRNYGEAAETKYSYDLPGGNYRMTDVAASIGLTQVRRSEIILSQRRRVIAEYLRRPVPGAPALPSYYDPDAHPSGFAFTVLCADRGRVARGLAERGIETRSMWSLCVDEQPVYRELPCKAVGGIQNARAFSRECLSLPLHAGVGEQEVARVVETLSELLDTAGFR